MCPRLVLLVKCFGLFLFRPPKGSVSNLADTLLGLLMLFPRAAQKRYLRTPMRPMGFSYVTFFSDDWRRLRLRGRFSGPFFPPGRQHALITESAPRSGEPFFPSDPHSYQQPQLVADSHPPFSFPFCGPSRVLPDEPQPCKLPGDLDAWFPLFSCRRNLTPPHPPSVFCTGGLYKSSPPHEKRFPQLRLPVNSNIFLSP